MLTAPKTETSPKQIQAYGSLTSVALGLLIRPSLS